MLTLEPTPEMVEDWKRTWNEYRARLKANRKTGQELLAYLTRNYVLTEFYDQEAADIVCSNIMQNRPLAEKLPAGAVPMPRTFFLEDSGKGEIFYKNSGRDPDMLWESDIPRIFVGIDVVSGYFMVEGSARLWDELCAYQGLDEADIRNPYCVAQYIACLRSLDLLNRLDG
jgi:hypothetical protein